MTDIATHLVTAKEEFAKHRVNKAVAALIEAVELLAAAQAGGAPVAASAAPAAPVALTEPAPAPVTAGTNPTTGETTPADLARILATQDRAATEEPAPKPARAPRKPAKDA